MFKASPLPAARPGPTPSLMFSLLFLLTLTLASPATAQNSESCPAGATPTADQIRAERLTGAIDLDGRLDETAWQRPGETRLVQYDPDNGCPPTQRSEFWIAYDDDALYLAAKLSDTAPDSIAARLGRRDTWPTSDWVYMNLDTFNDDRNAFSFSINPLGVIGDSALYNDGWGDNSWDGVWDVATQIDDEGWTLEARIPFSQLKFPDQEKQVWGINLSRRILRLNERADLFYRERGGAGYGRRFPDLVGIEGIRPSNQTEVRIYGLAKGEFLDVAKGDPFRDDPEVSLNAGIDVKTALSNNLTLTATANPDFGQVEVDPAVVNLGDYETFYSERRPFFVEDANTFRFGQEGTNNNWGFNWGDPRLFYSRRVGRYPQLRIEGNPDYVDMPGAATILGAAKVSGKIGNTSVGVLTGVTAREKAKLDFAGTHTEQVVEPLTNYTVARAKVASPDGRRGLGIMATGTLRDLDDPVSQASLDRRAFTGGLDGWITLDDDGVWALKGYLAGSHVSGSPEAISDLQLSPQRYYQRPDADYLEYDPDATQLRGWIGRTALNKQSGDWQLNSAFGYSSPGFEVNDVGYASRTDRMNFSVVPGYRWQEPWGIFRNNSLFWGNYKTWDGGGTPDAWGSGVFYWTEFTNYWSLDASAFFNPERNDTRLTRGGPVMRDSRSRSCDLSVATDYRKSWVLGSGVSWSDQSDGSRAASGHLSLELKPAASLSISVGPSYSWQQQEAQYYATVADPAMTATYDHHYVFADLEYREFSLETRIDWTFTPKLTLQAYVQPLFASGSYSDLKELARPHSREFNRYGLDNGSALVYDPAGDAGSPWLVTPDGDDPANTFRLRDRNFNFKSLKVNMVLRWEYSAGSTLFFVWTQDRADFHDPGTFDLSRDVRSLLDAQGENIFMLKISHYFSL